MADAADEDLFADLYVIEKVCAPLRGLSLT